MTTKKRSYIIPLFALVFAFLTTGMAPNPSRSAPSITSYSVNSSLFCTDYSTTMAVTVNLSVGGGFSWNYPVVAEVALGFANQNNINGSVAWSSGAPLGTTYTTGTNCAGLSTDVSVTFTSASSKSTVVNIKTPPNTGIVYNYVIMACRLSSAPTCGSFNDSDSVLIPCGAATPTFTPTLSPTVTLTPTITPTRTPTPTSTWTPTRTFTPLICPTPIGATSSTLYGGCTCFQNQSTLLSDTQVFGMSLANLQAVADYSGTEASPASILSPWKLTYYSGSVTFDTGATGPLASLDAQGLLVVDGNLDMEPGCCSFDGVIFCTGNVTIKDGDTVLGAIILGTPYYNGGGSTRSVLTISGSGGNYGQIIYSPVFVNEVQQKVAVYKEDFSQRKTYQTVPNW